MKIYSSNEEYYQYEDMHDAILDIYENETTFKVGDVIEIWKGELHKPKASRYVPSFLYETLNENAWENVGEWVDSWPDGTDQQRNELQSMVGAAVDAWADKYNLQPNFGDITNIKSVKVRIVQIEPDFDYVAI